jgi:hypothetical protein
VTFEVVSPGNRAGDLINRFRFYERYGVEEYYLWDLESGDLNGWRREQSELKPIAVMNGWTSPLLKVNFEVINGDLRLYGPDGKKFATYVQLVQQREQEAQARNQAEQRAERLAAQLKALGIEPEA